MAKPQQMLHLLFGMLILIAAAPFISEASPRGASSAVFPLSGDVYPNG
jgi:hypothetical protein